MAVTLAEAATLSTDHLQRGVLETFVQESPVLDRIPLMGIEGNSYAYNAESTLPGVEFRAVNSGYSESTGTFVQASESLVILGGDADVDTFIAQTRSDLNDQRAAQTRLKVKAASYRYQDAFINGDASTDPLAFDGLKRRLTGAQVLSAGTDGLGPVAGGHAFLDALEQAIAAVPGVGGNNGAIYANRAVTARIMSSARRLGGADMITEALTGKRVPTYQGIPILDPGQTADGTDILPMTETEGTATDASSIYVVKFGGDEGDQAVTGLTNGGVMVRDLGELDSKPAYRTRLEFFCGLATFGGRAASRLTGVLNA